MLRNSLDSAVNLRDTTLEDVAKYYLNPKNLASLRAEAARQGVLLTVSITSCFLYIATADKYAIAQFGSANLYMRSWVIISTSVPAMAVLYCSTDVFVERRNSQIVPVDLKGLLTSPYTPRQQLSKDLAIFTGSAASVIPLMFVSVNYPIPNVPAWVSILQTIIFGINNILLHAFPVELAFTPVWRWPVYLTLELPWHLIRHHLKTPVQKHQYEIRQNQKSIYTDLKNTMCQVLSRAQTNIDLNISLRGEISPALRVLLDNPENKTGYERLLQIAAFQPEYIPTTQSRIDANMQELAYILGAAWVTSSCFSFMLAAANGMIAWTGSEVAGIALSVPPIYCLTVLFTFWGGNSLRDTYLYLTRFDKNEVKVPLAAKLYPLAYYTGLIAAIYLTPWGYSASVQVLDDNTQDPIWDPVHLAFEILAISGLDFLSFSCLNTFNKLLIEKYATYFGNTDAKKTYQLKHMIENQKNSGYQLMDGKVLVENLEIIKQTKPEAVKTLTNLEPDEFRKLYDHLQALTTPAAEVVTIAIPSNPNTEQTPLMPHREDENDLLDSTADRRRRNNWCTWFSSLPTVGFNSIFGVRPSHSLPPSAPTREVNNALSLNT